MGRRAAGGTAGQPQAFPHNVSKCQSCSGATSGGCPPSRLPNGPWALIWMAPALRRMSRANRGSSSSGPRAGVSVTGAVKETFHPSFKGGGKEMGCLPKKGKEKHWLTKHLKNKKLKKYPFYINSWTFSEQSATQPIFLFIFFYWGKLHVLAKLLLAHIYA